MRENIHPKFQQVIFYDASADFRFLSASTKSSSETMEWEDGNTYPVIRVDTSSASHPFFTGRQRNVDVGGRVDRFNRKYNLNQDQK
ncbi:type B 50S ribosomal protein L31 [Paenibacillus sp. CAA11]|uniref:type B 50S ribosomal protein L31 n=1 Tax=Paenibacillus sp. CAA11 TaxID=1532905 RepID=UPI000D346D87|nr:type B 50S ribosomal protein L31 [Paenibacillus sp. CAA11]AWB44118.1 type B 50S ribosomal protein L31 [Paenibacillus sp. CAA11]